MLNGERRTGFHSDKERALLAYLCVERQGAHRREQLAGLLWPDYPESAARTNLRNALANLRKVIGDRSQNLTADAAPNFLVVKGKTIQFNVESDAWVDALAFLSTLEKSQATVAELEAAVAYYRDTFMAGFSLSDSDLFEEWLIIQRERFRRLAFDAHFRLVEAYTTQGEYKQALVHARHLVALDPLRESAQQVLMRLLTYNGQSNQALVQYETYTGLLADEIGVEPLDETTKLYLQIKDGNLETPKPNTIYKPAFLKNRASAEEDHQIFVDQENELDRLNHSLDKALASQGQVVFITGEAGSGKTALANEFLQQAMKSNSDLLAVRGRSNAYTGIGDPYLPFSEMMEMLSGEIEARWAGGEITGQHARCLWRSMPDVIQALLDNGPDLIDRLLSGRALLARARAGAPDQAARLAELLDRSSAATAEPSNLQQTDLFEQISNVLRALSQKHPLILVVDDLQWADPGSISLLFHLGRRLAGSRILLIGAYRPEEIAMGRMMASELERHPLAPVIHELQLEFGDFFIDLDKVEGRKFVDALIDTEPNCLSEDFRKVFYQHTNGYPLFTVELLRSLQSRGELTKDEFGRWIVKSALNWKFFPPRVDAVIAERMHRLPGEWQSILTAASVEGEEFSAEVIALVTGIDEEQVLSLLSGPLSHKHHLVQAQDLKWLGDQRQSHYRFRHFLFQKFLYDQLDPVQRAHLHQSVGTALETLYGDQTGELAVSLAWHFEAAGMKLKAAEYLRQAGARAFKMFAYEETVAHFRHGLDLIKTLPETPQRDQVEVSLLLGLGTPLVAVKSPTDAETEQVYGRVRQLTQNIEPSFELFQALLGLKDYYDLRLELQRALNLGHEMRELAQSLAMPELLVLAHHEIGITLLYLGRAEDFLKQQQQMLALYNAEYDHAWDEKLGYDLLHPTLCNAGWALKFLGYADQSEECYKKVLNLVSESDQPYFKANTLMSASFHYLSLRDVARAREIAEKTIALSREHGYSFCLGGALGAMGWLLGEEGHLEEEINMIHDGLAIVKEIGSWLLYQQELSMLADAYCKAGKISEGLAVIEEAMVMVHEKGFLLEEPKIHRIKGELLLLEGGANEEAQVCFQRAIEAACRFKAKFSELRATVSLCRLLQKQGKREQARRMLAEIYDWFTEGFETPDLQEAKSLLEALS
jgi:DNA-binding SARP family transcriptional activator